MANPFPFSAGAVLTAAQLNAQGEWEDYTPASTSWSGTYEVSRTARIADIVFWRVRFTLDATPSGTLTITPPFTGASFVRGGSAGGGYAYDTSGDDSYAVSPYISGSNVQLIETQAQNQTAVTATSPFTWASGDSFRFLMIYEQA